MFFLGSLIAFSSLRCVLIRPLRYALIRFRSALYNLVEVRGLFLRERAGSFYSFVHPESDWNYLTRFRPQAWLLSRIMFDLIPLRLIPTILVGVIVYFSTYWLSVREDFYAESISSGWPFPSCRSVLQIPSYYRRIFLGHDTFRESCYQDGMTLANELPELPISLRI
jgi:hypothetical protein